MERDAPATPGGTDARPPAPASWAVHPNSAFKRRWDYLTSLLAVCVVFGPELRGACGALLGLEEPSKPAHPSAAAVFLARGVNIWFLADMLLNFLTGYVDRKGVRLCRAGPRASSDARGAIPVFPDRRRDALREPP